MSIDLIWDCTFMYFLVLNREDHSNSVVPQKKKPQNISWRTFWDTDMSRHHLAISRQRTQRSCDIFINQLVKKKITKNWDRQITIIGSKAHRSAHYSRISRYYVKWLFISSFKWRTRSVENDIRRTWKGGSGVPEFVLTRCKMVRSEVFSWVNWIHKQHIDFRQNLLRIAQNLFFVS
jgi:hypothetical protein